MIIAYFEKDDFQGQTCRNRRYFMAQPAEEILLVCMTLGLTADSVIVFEENSALAAAEPAELSVAVTKRGCRASVAASTTAVNKPRPRNPNT